jgi:hypothetical protein
MAHKEHPQELSVGCVCAGKMTDDYLSAKERERKLRNRAGLRNRWLTRVWRVSKNSNEYINFEGHNVGVFSRNGGWTCWIDKKISVRNFATKEAAKIYLFDRLMKQLDQSN